MAASWAPNEEPALDSHASIDSLVRLVLLRSRTKKSRRRGAERKDRVYIISSARELDKEE